MSKKMLKRSLALGALMTFVITGSAMAATTVVNNATANQAIAIGTSQAAEVSVAIGRLNNASASSSVAIGVRNIAGGDRSVALGYESVTNDQNSIAIGYNTSATGSNSVVLGSGSSVTGHYGVAIGSGSTSAYRGISIGDNATAASNGIAMGFETNSTDTGNVAIGLYADATNESATAIGYNAEATGNRSSAYGADAKAEGIRSTALGYSTRANGLGDLAIGAHSATVDVASVNSVVIGGKQYDFAGGDGSASNYVAAASLGGKTTSSAFGASSNAPKTIYRQLQNVAAGQVSETSTDAVNGSQLYAAYDAIGNNAEAIALKANADDVYTKDETDTKLDAKADQADLDAEAKTRETKDNELLEKINQIGGGSSDAINGINQRLDRTNAKINKVGAGAAALAALHPLDYDPDDKLTFSAGVGNYAGENAAALGAFYRPNEKFMVSLGGTMGNGENMVNLGFSIGLDKASGLAKLSKKELVQKVNSMEAEMAEMKAMLQELLAKK